MSLQVQEDYEGIVDVVNSDLLHGIVAEPSGTLYRFCLYAFAIGSIFSSFRSPQLMRASANARGTAKTMRQFLWSTCGM